MRIIPLYFSLIVLCLTGCATSNKHILKIDSTPTEAMVSTYGSRDLVANSKQLAGITPLEAAFDFGEAGQLWVKLEKRGYADRVVTVLTDTAVLSIDLEKIKYKNGQDVSSYALPNIKRILLVNPDIKIYERGFSSESISQEKSLIAQKEFTNGIEKFFQTKYQVVVTESSDFDKKLLRPIWGDIKSAMELLDPVGLKYSALPPFLETKRAREALLKLGDKYDAEVILFIKGKQNIEKGGYQAGVIGTSIVGTAASFAGGYGRAITDHNSFFFYNVYTPSFDQGTLVGKAALVNCINSEILWVNRGLLDNVLTDLFAVTTGN